MRYGGTKATNAIQSVVAKGLADVNFGKGYWGALKRVGWLSIILFNFNLFFSYLNDQNNFIILLNV